MSKAIAAELDSEEGVARRAFLGTVSLSLANLIRLGLQLALLPILARILGPSAFGMVAMAAPFILFATLLSDAGMGNALIQNGDASPETESTVFWMSVAISLALIFCIWLGSGAVESAMHQPGLGMILLAMAPILVLSSTLSVPNSRLSRARRFGVFAVSDLVSALLSSAAALAAALNGWGAWSLVVQQLVLWIVKVAWIFPASRFRPLFVWRSADAGTLMHFALNSVGATIADFAGKAAPAVVIGGTLGVLAAGHYSMAYQLVRIPDLILSGPLYLATFTALSNLKGSREASVEVALRTVRLAVIALAPVFCGLALVADLLTGALLGPKWEGIAPVVAILCGSGFLICLNSLFGAILMGLGRADLQFRLCALGGVALLTGAFIGQKFGLQGAVIGIGLGLALALPFYLAILTRLLGGGAGRVAACLAKPLIAAAAMATVVLVLRARMSLAPPMVQLAVSGLVGALAFAVVLAASSGRQVLDDVRLSLPRRAKA